MSILGSYPLEWYAKRLGTAAPVAAPKPVSPAAQQHREDWIVGQEVVREVGALHAEQHRLVKKMSKGADLADLLIETDKLDKLTDAHNAAKAAVAKSYKAYFRATGQKPRLTEPAAPKHRSPVARGKWLLLLATLMRLPLSVMLAVARGFADGWGGGRRRV